MTFFFLELLPKIPPRQTINSASSITCKNENDVQEPHIIKQNLTSFREQKYELNYIQEHSINSLFKNALTFSNSSKVPEETLKEIKVPSAPVEEKLTVLIQHAESEYEIAEQLSTDFFKDGVIATTLSDVNDFTLYEPTNVLKTLFEEVFFFFLYILKMLFLSNLILSSTFYKDMIF